MIDKVIEEIRLAKAKKNLTLQDIAKITGLSYVTVHKIISKQNGTIQNLKKIVDKIVKENS